jgi:PncC family amidohydrolase
MQIAKELQTVFSQKKMTLALAESCTGGAMASFLTRVAGSSIYFLGSLVVYSNELKRKLLHVKEETLKTYGAVSQEVVSEMLEGLFLQTSADWGVAISGIAGPTGGSREKPVGLVWVALGQRGKNPDIFSLMFEGSRQKIIDETVLNVLERLWKKVVL